MNAKRVCYYFYSGKKVAGVLAGKSGITNLIKIMLNADLSTVAVRHQVRAIQSLEHSSRRSMDPGSTMIGELT